MSQFFYASIFLITVNILMGNIPGIMSQFSRFIGLLLLTVWVRLYFPIKIKKSNLKTTVPALFIIIASLALLLQGGFATLLGLAIFVFALQILLRGKMAKGIKGKEAKGQVGNPSGDPSLCSGGQVLDNYYGLPVCLLTICFYMGFTILYRFVPLLWYLLQNISLTLSAAITSIIGQKITLGATAMGIPISISLFCYCLSAFVLAQERKISRLLLSVLILIGANVAYLWLQTPLTMLVNLINRQSSIYYKSSIYLLDDKWHPNALDFQSLLLLLSMGAIYPMTKGIQFRKIPLGFSTIRWQYALSAVILLFLACLMLTFPINGKREQGSVVFYNKGYLNWNTPVFGKYGQSNVGMFGLLPKYLKLRGYQTKISDAPLTEKALQDAKVLVVINLTEFLSGEEKQTILNFVQDGGSLLVLGDHTDVMGIMNKLNDLIQPFNISLNFDSVLPLKTGWVDSLEKRPHPITVGLKDDSDTAIWVGSSLSIGSQAQAVIIGKRGWSDHGDYQNTKRAFLGDYQRSGDEQLGDLILVASSRYGKGKVLVFGDTSTFQNGVLMCSYQFVDRVFDWLTRTGDSQNSPIRILIALLLLIPHSSALRRKFTNRSEGDNPHCRRNRRSPAPLLTCSPAHLPNSTRSRMSLAFMLSCILAVSIALTISSAFQVSQTEIYQISSDSSLSSFFKFAYIDGSHFERYSRTGGSDNSIWGLSMNLARNGYIPLIMDEFSEQALFNSRLFVVIAPTKKFSSHEINLLTQYMQTGGIVIWTVGWEESEASNNFLSKYNFSLDSVPLGPAEVSIQKQNVQFFEAWPVLGGSNSKRAIATKWDYPIIVYEPIGKGGLLVVGDSGFLLNKNLESYRKYFKNDNILFLYYLLKQLKEDFGG